MFTNYKSVRKYELNAAQSPKLTVLVTPSLIHQFLTTKVTFFDGDKKCEAVSHVDDIYMLFNQQRLLHAGTDTINAWLNTLTPRSDALAELRKKCTDEQLLHILKSRYIQSPSELLAWSEYLNANYSDIIERMQQTAQRQQQEAQRQQQEAQQQQHAAQQQQHAAQQQQQAAQQQAAQ